ncbi:hypothetical protein A1Q2_04015 [Trichosporon asahii var. asahii CBS 8904]|uniref:AMP-dependent synthetase/ligase domain-containing protein n=1 Tax=Trichosporon asahii var. asahii (strain CBS 8904) TaxID=1220162 RepID=K1WK16_TRIAC|nr:hypothetical protein A1Q2_04015 [Trichosporon asahii var. asahii CBS 8904]
MNTTSTKWVPSLTNDEYGMFPVEEMVLAGRRQKVYKNVSPPTSTADNQLPKTFRHLLREGTRKFADRVVVSSPIPLPADFYAREELTFQQVYDRALALAGILRERGVKVGDKVALGGNNSADWVIAFVALQLLGVNGVLLNATLTPEAQVHCLALTGPKFVLVEEAMAGEIGPLADELKSKGVGPIWCWSSVKHLPAAAQAGVQEISSLKPAAAQTVRDIDAGTSLEGLEADSDAFIAFTSGTTSMPKGVLLSHRAALHMLQTSPLIMARALLRNGRTLDEVMELMNTPPPQQPCHLMATPLFHVTALCGGFIAQYASGIKSVFMRRWSVPEAVKLIVANNVQFLGGVPAVVQSVLQSPDLPKDWVFNRFSYGGAPPPTRLAGDLVKRWPGAMPAMHVGFCGPDYVSKPEAVGPPMPINEIRIVDPETRAVLPTRGFGIIEARGSNMMKGYYNNPKANIETINEDGWLDTGDMGFIDEDGDLWIPKDMIIRGGENIASAEVEYVVSQDERMACVAAVAVPDDVLGELVGIAVELAPGQVVSPQEIIDFADARLRYPARPVICVVFDELRKSTGASPTDPSTRRDEQGAQERGQEGSP